jgi:hypothetical protein
MTAKQTVVLVLGIVSAAPLVSQGALMAYDDASSSVYNDGWAGGDNGGYGFNAWTLDAGGTGYYGHFIGDSRNLTDSLSGANINVSGESFGMYANSGSAYAGAARNFTGGALAAGQQFSFVIGVNYRNGNKGFDLRDGSGSVLWNFNVGGDAYKVNGNSVFGNAYDANTAFSFLFTQNAGTLDWSITRSGGLSGTASGSSSISAGNIAGVRFYISGTDGGNENDFFFNSLSVVPEPTHVALGVFGGVLALTGVLRSSKLKALLRQRA